jgi:hypothetical protein
MMYGQGSPYSGRGRIASAISPERVALILVIVLAIVAGLAVGLLSPDQVDVGRPSPGPSAAPSSSSG